MEDRWLGGLDGAAARERCDGICRRYLRASPAMLKVPRRPASTAPAPERCVPVLPAEPSFVFAGIGF